MGPARSKLRSEKSIRTSAEWATTLSHGPKGVDVRSRLRAGRQEARRWRRSSGQRRSGELAERRRKDLIGRPRGVDRPDPVGLGAREGRVCVEHPGEERVVLTLQSVGLADTLPLSRARARRIELEQERPVGGEPAGGKAVERPNAFDPEFAATALVGREESMNRSSRIQVPDESVGSNFCSTSCARAAAYSRASVDGWTSSVASATSARMRSETSTPPGSRRRATVIPRSANSVRSRCARVVLPVPSIPSIVISRPRPVIDPHLSDGRCPRGHYDRSVPTELDRHPSARALLGPALEPGGRPSHAYLFHGPGGAGKRSVAREFAASLLTAGSPDPEGARARALAGSHPDLTWVAPSGAHEILVSDIDGPVVAAASRTPFESSRRVFVIERVDELGDEAANRMLKTLEEPASFVHVILITDRPTEVLPTIRSRCQHVRFESPPVGRVADELAANGTQPSTAMACARLSLGDGGRARELATEQGVELRTAAERFAGAVLAGEAASTKPWVALLEAVKARGELIADELREAATAEVEMLPSRERKRAESAWDERKKRSRRRVETGTLDLGLQLVSLWLADLAVLAWGAEDLVRHVDRMDMLRAQMSCEPHSLRRAIELVEETRLRFALNVSEDLACEALAYRLERVLAG